MDFNSNTNSRIAVNPNYYNVNTSHPIVQNSQEYILYKKYVSIHSQDRDIQKFPQSTDFEIEMPEDMLNVSSIKLTQWTFPANYSTFSLSNNNLFFSFSITEPYNPTANGVTDLLAQGIFDALNASINQPYTFLIEEGFYNPDQMVAELTNKMNTAVNIVIETYFTNTSQTDLLNQFISEGGYMRFVVVYNTVSCKIWFGNRADNFCLNNESGLIANKYSEISCGDTKSLPDYSAWGLPGYLGLTRTNSNAIGSSDFTIQQANASQNLIMYNGICVPRFYYGDITPGDSGYWLLPYSDLSGSEVYWVEATYKINLMGEAYMYLELGEQNCLDETKPYNVSQFTLTTNKTNGVVNSAFAKISIPTTPIAQWFDRDSMPYKFYYPPAERIRRLRIRLRYHNGQLVDFGLFNFSIMLEFAIMLPMMLRKTKTEMYPIFNGL
jgi:hypothetical protein